MSPPRGDGSRAAEPAPERAFWSEPAEALTVALRSGPRGLSEAEAALRLARDGANAITPRRTASVAALLLTRLRDPLSLILVTAAVIALATRDWLEACIVLAIVAISAVLGAVQEYRASVAVERLRQRISARAVVVRDGAAREIPAEQVVAGDLVQLSAGSLVPADGRVLSAKDCFVTQGLLTGEPLPVEKRPRTVAPGASLAGRDNCVFMGTSVRSGTATVLVLATGARSVFGGIAGTLALRPPETEFERGLKQLGALLLRVMIAVVIVVLAINLLLQRPPIETLLFAMALAVGISPELLPAVLGITLSHGAHRMARAGVIVRRLNAIENLGAMDVLCTDKTGTLTRGVVRLDAAQDPDGRPSDALLTLAVVNACLQTGLRNALDEAIAAAAPAGAAAGFEKVDEVPYDFVRKRMSVVASARAGGMVRMITKGALDSVLSVCDRRERAGGVERLDAAALETIRRRFAEWSAQGFRVLGVAWKDLAPGASRGLADETAMVFAGFLLFFDPPEPQAVKTLRALRRLGVRVKIITGDNRLVARHVAEGVGLNARRILTGAELAAMRDEALWHLAPRVSLFAEVDPNQKERVIRALQKTGHVVGFLGDGVNDAPALHAADVGISVDQAVDVARQAADFVLLKHDLDVLRQGIEEGRHTFANTLKYVFITTSANFGNMISMAVASLALPFLPLLAAQILLNNFLSDVPALGIARDNVDRDWARTPHRWQMREVRDFMLRFGLISSAFDLLTFGALLALAGEAPAVFRTGWFVESLLTEILVIFVVRTYRPLWRSRPAPFLAASGGAVAALALLLPVIPLGALFGFVPLPGPVLVLVVGISLTYALVSEAAKRRFYPASVGRGLRGRQ